MKTQYKRLEHVVIQRCSTAEYGAARVHPRRRKGKGWRRGSAEMMGLKENIIERERKRGERERKRGCRMS